MMGMNANQEDMFGKLEEMRSVITEVNNQFKDPVSLVNDGGWDSLPFFFFFIIEHHYLYLCLYL